MANRELLRINTGAADSSLFLTGFQNSFWVRRPWRIQSDKTRARQRKLITQNISLGGEASFDYEKDGVLLEDTYLEVKLSAITPNGVGSYARFCDYVGFALIKSMTLMSSQNQLQKKQGNHLFINHLRDHDIQHRDVFESMVKGELTDAQRNTLATADQVIKIPLKFFWYGLACHTPVITALAQRLNVKIEFASKEDIIQTDYSLGADCTMRSLNWIYDVINFTGEDRNQATVPTFTPRGQTFLIEQTNSGTTQYYKIDAGKTEELITFSGFTAPWSCIYAIFQPYSKVSVQYQKAPFEPKFSDLNLIDSIQLRDNELIINDIQGIAEIAEKWNKYHVIGQWRKPVIYMGVTEIADIKNQNLGSLNSSNMNNFNFRIKFKSPLPEDYSIGFVFMEHNWVNHQAGEMQKAFSN